MVVAKMVGDLPEQGISREDRLNTLASRFRIVDILKCGEPLAGRVSGNSSAHAPTVFEKKVTWPTAPVFWLRSLTATGPVTPLRSASRTWLRTGDQPMYCAAGAALPLIVISVLIRLLALCIIIWRED